jgi:hypothetical protein
LIGFIVRHLTRSAEGRYTARYGSTSSRSSASRSSSYADAGFPQPDLIAWALEKVYAPTRSPQPVNNGAWLLERAPHGYDVVIVSNEQPAGLEVIDRGCRHV